MTDSSTPDPVGQGQQCDGCDETRGALWHGHERGHTFCTRCLFPDAVCSNCGATSALLFYNDYTYCDRCYPIAAAIVLGRVQQARHAGIPITSTTLDPEAGFPERQRPRGGKKSPFPLDSRQSKALHALELKAEGKSWNEIARRLYTPRSTIYDWSRKLSELPDHTGRKTPDNRDRQETAE